MSGLFGCGSGSSASQAIGATGGTITLESGASVVIPAGAVSKGVDVAIELVDDSAAQGWAALPEGVIAAAATSVVLTPHGTTFDKPVTVTMPTTLTGTEVVLLQLDDESSTEWKPAGPITVGAGEISFDVMHFSVYSAVNVAAGSCPCWSGAELASYKTKAAAQSATTQWQNWAGGTYNVHYVPFTVAGARKAELRVSSQTNTKFFCERVSSDATAYFAPIQKTITVAEHAACLGLLYASMAQNVPGRQLAVFADVVPAGDSLEVSVAVTDSAGAKKQYPLTLSASLELAWLQQIFADGAAYDVTITRQPATTTCTIANPKGTLQGANHAVEVTCVNTGCNVELTGSAATLGASPTTTPISLKRPALCSFYKDTDDKGVVRAALLLVHDRPFPAGFDLESVASWSAYAAGGGQVLGFVSFADAIAVPLTKQTGGLGDVTLMGAAGLGTIEFVPDSSSFDITAVDASAKTFEMSLTLTVQGGDFAWPPVSQNPTSTDSEEKDRTKHEDLTGTATGKISGTYTEVTFTP
ncbi:MAG: hypothetical protein R3F39_19255 [Myxococcota bacterium]